jgi:hypothetical protein
VVVREQVTWSRGATTELPSEDDDDEDDAEDARGRRRYVRACPL